MLTQKTVESMKNRDDSENRCVDGKRWLVVLQKRLPSSLMFVIDALVEDAALQKAVQVSALGETKAISMEFSLELKHRLTGLWCLFGHHIMLHFWTQHGHTCQRDDNDIENKQRFDQFSF